MATWSELATQAPELAAFGEERFKKGVAFLATTRKDGSPRVHPVTPIISQGRLFLFMEPTSPKGNDLRRDGRFALHALVTKSSGEEGEFFIHGTARFTDNPEDRKVAIAGASYQPSDRYILFELSVSAAFSNEYVDGNAQLKNWKEA